ncbi:two-component sensor histidine kinase [Mucilaginibacter rubeus]|uniref:tetratricopeptide repeat-containing sensor histidine kinase n=1 Tax=Mucilaginibacter rubeus TaxID=2027860 RepID=UPI003397FEB8
MLLIMIPVLTYPGNIFAQHAHLDVEGANLKRQLSSAKDTARARTLLSLGIFYADKKGPKKDKIDSAMNYYRQGLAISEKLNYSKGRAMADLLSAKIDRLKGDMGHLRSSLEKAISAAKKGGFADLIADAETEQAYYYIDAENDPETSNTLYSSAIAIYRKIAPNSLKLAYALQYHGFNQTMLKDPDKGIRMLDEALTIYQAHKVTELANVYHMLASCYHDKGDFNNAIRYALMCLRYEERDHNLYGMVAIYTVLAEIYHEKNMPAVQISYLEKGLIAVKTLSENYKVFIIATLGNAYVTVHQYEKAITLLNRGLKECSPKDPIYARLYTALTDAYVATGQYAAANRTYILMMKAISPGGYAYAYTTIQAHFAAVRLFMGTRQFIKAKEHIQALQDTTYIKKYRPDMIMLEHLSFQLDSATGNYLAAIHHYQRFKAVSDSVEKLSNSKQVAALQIQYETEKKDQEIALKSRNINLLTQQTHLQEKALSSQKQARNLLYGSIVLLIVLLGLGYNRYQIKQRATRELAEQQLRIQSQNTSLRELVTEREWLLKEVHHRVKNNLQIVISLLNSPSSYLNDETAIGVIRESQHRMQSISLIHQKLYQTDNLSGIDMHCYIHELLNYLEDCFSTSGYIVFLTDIDKFILDVSQAVPLGLILNEGITNAIKYAFKGRDHGAIIIKLKQEQERLYLQIADNGIGVPDDFNIDGLNSMGMNLMKGLSRQLGASFDLTNDDGLSIEMRWKKTRMLTDLQEPQLAEALA